LVCLSGRYGTNLINPITVPACSPVVRVAQPLVRPIMQPSLQRLSSSSAALNLHDGAPHAEMCPRPQSASTTARRTTTSISPPPRPQPLCQSQHRPAPVTGSWRRRRYSFGRQRSKVGGDEGPDPVAGVHPGFGSAAASWRCRQPTLGLPLLHPRDRRSWRSRQPMPG
jgi:hypothetical protein